MRTAPATTNLQACIARSRSAAVPADPDVVFWQERPPALVCNAARVSIEGVTVRVVHSCDMYSSVAFGPAARHVSLLGCQIMGGTGLRMPPRWPRTLPEPRLSLDNCEIQVCALVVVLTCTGDSP